MKLKGIKKITALALLTVIMLTDAVFAAEVFAPSAPPPSYISGSIVNETDSVVEIKPTGDGGSVILNLGARVYVADCVTGQPVSLKDRIDDYVIAYYGPTASFSLPPQSNAILIICNIPQDYIPPRFGRVEGLTKSEDGSQVKVTVDGGSLSVAINRDSPISPYLTRNIVTIDNIETGSDLLMWYPFAAQSYPAQATASKTVILGRADTPAAEERLYPLVSLARALGFTVTQDAEAQSAKLVKGGKEYTVTVAEADAESGAVPVLKDGRIFVPASFFESIGIKFLKLK